MALLLCIYQKQYLLERLETINRPPAGGLSPVRGPSIGSSTNIHSDLPRNRYIGGINDVTVTPCSNPRGLMRTNKRKLQEGQIQAVPKLQPLADQHWTAHSLTTVYKNAFPTMSDFHLGCYGFRSPIKLGTNTHAHGETNQAAAAAAIEVAALGKWPKD